MAKAPTGPQISTTPKTTPNGQWPGAFGIFKLSLATVAFNIWVFLAVNILSGIVSLLPNALDNITSLNDMTIMVIGILTYIPSIIFTVMGTVVLLKALDERKLTLGEAFQELSIKMVLCYFVVSALTFVIAIISLLLLIVPFFFIVPRIVMAQYYVIDQNMGVIASLKASWAQTKGHVGKVYGIIGATIAMFLPVLTLIGIPVAIFLVIAYSAAFPILFRHIIGKNPIKPAIAS